MKSLINNSSGKPGLYTLALRWVIGWTYFSAFWRRLILTNKLIPEEAGYIGEKFNHFLPNAIGIKPLIEYLVRHPESLQTAMVVFTIVEAIVGLFLILGLFTRLMSLGVMALAMGILLGSGWIGTTCLDEWQIGILGVAGGFVLFLSGSDVYSMDHFLRRENLPLTQKKWFPFMASGPLPIKHVAPKVLFVSVLIFALTLFTNQYFHGGVWGTLHNKSVKPKIEISKVQASGTELLFRIYRVEGADVYGSFLIGIQILDEKKKMVYAFGQEDLSHFTTEQIQNHYVAKIKPGAHSLIIPLGAKADIKLKVPSLENAKNYTLKLIDISGIEWEAAIP